MTKLGKIYRHIFWSIRRVYRFFTRDIWIFDISELSHPKAFMHKAYTFISASIRDYGVKKIGTMSASLSYFCTMAFVPFIAVCLALAGDFGLENYFYDILYNNIEDPQLGQLIAEAADNIVQLAQKGGFGLISALAFVWMVIWMMNRVEKVFNDVWRINDKTVEREKRNKKNRNFFASFGIDLTILLIAPFLLVLFFAGTIVYSKVLDVVIPNNIGFSSEIKSFIGWLFFALISILILSVMYKYIPSTKVKYRHAFRAAIVAGIAFTVLQYLYLGTQVLVTRINTVYGTMAAIPLFLVWMRFGWLIAMLGAQLSYSMQNYDKIIEEAQQL